MKLISVVDFQDPVRDTKMIINLQIETINGTFMKMNSNSNAKSSS